MRSGTSRKPHSEFSTPELHRCHFHLRLRRVAVETNGEVGRADTYRRGKSSNENHMLAARDREGEEIAEGAEVAEKVLSNAVVPPFGAAKRNYLR